jgi:hypothetical protein
LAYAERVRIQFLSLRHRYLRIFLEGKDRRLRATGFDVLPGTLEYADGGSMGCG